jgi:hypothetical protein
MVEKENQSVAGEEDPGASLDGMPAGARPTAGAQQDALMLRRAVARWENEGGTEPGAAEASADAAPKQARVNLGDAELVQLQLRVIALENLETALLANVPHETVALARAIAANISPRPGATPHHLTVRAAAQMIHLLERAEASKTSRFGAVPDAPR